MNVLTLIIIWVICYPVACELTNVLYHLRLTIDKKKKPSLDNDFKTAAIYMAIYIFVIVWLLSIYYGENR